MIPLEVTHEVQAQDKISRFLERRNNHPFAKSIFEMLKAFKIMYK
jgi:inosine-uridine nucleoside N-ribohydrolase